MRIVDVKQGTAPWAEARRGIPSASRFKDILTPKKMEIGAGATSYCYELIAESIVPPHYWVGDDYQSAAMMHGNATEQEASRYLEMMLCQPITETGFCLTDDGRFGASPDRLIGDDAGLELKCPMHKTQIRYLVEGALPDEYRAQVHGNMIVTGRKVWWFCSYAVGLPPLVLKIEPDEYTVKLAEALEKFWKMLSEMRERIATLGDPVACSRTPVQPYF